MEKSLFSEIERGREGASGRERKGRTRPRDNYRELGESMGIRSSGYTEYAEVD